MIIEDAITRTADELGLDKGFVKDIYMAYWKAIRNHISQIPMKDDLSQEELESYRPTVTMPSLGKLACPWERYSSVKKKYEYIKKFKDEWNKAEATEGGEFIDEQH